MFDMHTTACAFTHAKRSAPRLKHAHQTGHLQNYHTNTCASWHSKRFAYIWLHSQFVSCKSCGVEDSVASWTQNAHSDCMTNNSHLFPWYKNTTRPNKACSDVMTGLTYILQALVMTENKSFGCGSHYYPTVNVSVVHLHSGSSQYWSVPVHF